MMQAMRCRPEEGILVLIDIQHKLAQAMPEALYARLKNSTKILLTAANKLAIPTVITLQYPQGLGGMDHDLQQILPEDSKILEKTCFSCVGSTDFVDHLKTLARRQICLVGMETHICVMQTALDLMQTGYQVFVVEDASCSRRSEHHENAMLRLRQAGVSVTTTESTLFEWLQDARHAHFKTLSRLII